MNTLVEIDPYAQLTGPTTLVINRLLPGPRDRVWRYITQSDLRAKWLASGEMPLEPGAEFSLTWNNGEIGDPPAPRDTPVAPHTMACRMIEADPPTRLHYEWIDVGDVTFELSDHADGVLLTLTHARLTTGANRLNVLAGWHAHFEALEAVCAGRPRADLMTRHAALKQEYDARTRQG
ncbi:SRPBCC family protein [Tropicibacter sp. S64]|uniref:SRPBCC family protein n=1 Tax=Tropicibacter sp. S64 TaxID=3415122 RepID=UPI003C7AF03F